MSNGPDDSRAGAEGAPEEPGLMAVVVKSATEAQDVRVAEGSTVAQLKEQAARHFTASKDRMLLIFAGKILEDHQTLRQHDIRDGLTVHLVVRKPEPLKAPALRAHRVEPGCSASAPPGAHPAPAGIPSMPAPLESARRDLATLLDVLRELPQHFQARPELMQQVVQSPTVQGLLSGGSGGCGPLAVTLILAVATLISLSASGPSAGEEKAAIAEEIARALEATGARDMLTHTKEMAHFLSETPELQQFAQDTPQFGQMMRPSGLTRLMVTYKKLARLRSPLDPEVDGSLTGDLLDEVRSFQQLMADISRVLSSPETQEELEERALRHVVMTSASFQQLAQRNVQIGHLLNNPQVVGQIVKYIRSPEIRGEMDRHHDRILKNLESLPGGYNLLHKVYTEVEEPIWHIVQEQHKGSCFAPLEGGSPDLGGRHRPPCMENRSPLPDPWALLMDTAPPRTGKSSSQQTGAAEEGRPSLPHEPGRPFVALDLGTGSGASPSPGVPTGHPTPAVQASPSSSSSSSQDTKEDPLVQEQAAQTGSEQYKEPHERGASLALLANSEDPMEAEDGQSADTDTPAGPKPSS